MTGAGSGIGRACALRLLSEKSTVVGTDVNAEGLANTLRMADEQGDGDRFSIAEFSIADESAVEASVANAISTLGGLDVLVNAAGILKGAHTHECSLDTWQQIIDVNLTGTFLVTRESLPALLESEHGGAIVNFGSTSTAFGHPYMAAYAASKGAITSFTYAIAREYGHRGLRASVVAPGGIDTGITRTTVESVPGDVDWGKFGHMMPLFGEGMGQPDHVAAVVAMLCSDDGAYVTGTEIRIDGGAHA